MTSTIGARTDQSENSGAGRILPGVPPADGFDPFSRLLGDRRGTPAMPDSTPVARARKLAARMPDPLPADASEAARRRWRGQLRGLAGGLNLKVSPRRKATDVWLVFEPGEPAAFALLTHERVDDRAQAWALWICAGSAA
jgi:hypothetical protein